LSSDAPGEAVNSIYRRDPTRLLPVTESVVLPAFSGSGNMPAYQSVPEFDLSRKYHLKAAGCEQCAERASDPITEQEWQDLATQWHSMADQAARMAGEAWQDRFE
jgi:hypothetical protein